MKKILSFVNPKPVSKVIRTEQTTQSLQRREPEAMMRMPSLFSRRVHVSFPPLGCQVVYNVRSGSAKDGDTSENQKYVPEVVEFVRCGGEPCFITGTFIV